MTSKNAPPHPHVVRYQIGDGLVAARRELLHQAQAADSELRANQVMSFAVPESGGHNDRCLPPLGLAR
jgi:hypothetical protein